MNDLKINENIVLLRKKNGITQKELARNFNVTSQAISKWESGKSCPDIALLPKIAHFFDVSIDELMGEEPLEKTTSFVKAEDA